MSIITHKPQTTRHRIIGLVSGEDYQIVFSDTPGIVRDPSYKMHEVMNKFVDSTFEDADLMLFVTDTQEHYKENDPIIERLRSIKLPLFLLINKVDLVKPVEVLELIQWWNDKVQFSETFPISALKKHNTELLLEYILKNIPEGPAYYPKDQLTDKPERFFVSEIIREKILLQYKQEIPYACEVTVESFKEEKNITRISAMIYVARKTQKSIIIGKDGVSIKWLGTNARKDIEKFLETKVFLELRVKVRDNWRDDEQLLKSFGYKG